jgi:hypothetical protein
MEERKSVATGKRNPGFVKIRRGLLEHWPAMSVNARAFYVWLHLTAIWREGPKRGWVEASYDDMARANGWSVKTIQRTIDELEAKPYIEVERAANQYELTRIKILKYDLEDPTSAVDKFDRSNQRSIVAQVSVADYAADGGVDKFDRSVVHSKPAESQNALDLQAPKKSKNLRSTEENAVRRPLNAELRHSRDGFSPSAKRENLEGRLAAKIAAARDSYSDYIQFCQRKGREHPFGKLERETFTALEYELDVSSPLVSRTFVFTAAEVYQENRGRGLSLGVLCCKVIDMLDRYRREDKECAAQSGRPSDGYFYPPDFKEHRDRLRARERLHEQGVHSTREARA